MVEHTCAQCGDLYPKPPDAKGQAASWCRPCRRNYMREYTKARYVPRPPRPTKPKPPPRRCTVCDVTLLPGKRTLCGSEACNQENSRRHSRKRRAEKSDQFVAAKRREYRRRRAARRSVDTEPYDPIDIAARDGWRCALCGGRIKRNVHYLHPQSLTMDHVIPMSKGGHDVAANVNAAHRLCNSTKGNRIWQDGEQLRLIG